MRILVDTHIFLWAITDDPRLSNAHRDLYADESSDLHFSIASVWEMMIKSGLGKLALPAPAAPWVFKQLDKNRLTPLSIRPEHLAELETLPPLHRDPFDRMLIAQAKAEKMPILSGDPGLRRYDVTIL